MIYTITVKDATGKPVAAAYVNFVAQGVNQATLATDANGQITLDDTTDGPLLGPGVTMTVTAPGFNGFSVAASSVTPAYLVTLGKGFAGNTLLIVALLGIAAFALKDEF